MNEQINISGMLGISSLSQLVESGWQSYYSVNPDLIFSWSQKQFTIYVEAYGQSRTGPDQGSGYNMDAGILYLVKKNIAVDCSVGHQLSGDLGGFQSYVGAGLSILF